MAELSGMRLAVIGAGVFGLCTALRAAHAGATVEVWDPAPLGDNASGVAAGMIAPVGELLFDPIGRDHFALFKAGRDGWRDIEVLAPALQIDRSGAIFSFSDDADRDEAELSLSSKGASLDRLGPQATPSLFNQTGRPQLFTREDWRVDAPAALHALQVSILAYGGVFKIGSLTPGDLESFDAAVLAAGQGSRAFEAVAPELNVLQPIKGQIVRFAGGPSNGPMLRTRDIYLAPQAGGLLAGATMEIGRSDRSLDPVALQGMRAKAVSLSPALADLPFDGLAGVRASTPDGLPMAGPSSRAGLHLAVGARRNGWLLAPLVSQIVLSYLSGGDSGPFATALDPRRFFHA